jgi:translation initiation factor IF-2
LGHVDHGKTTLLDKIRKTSVAEKEAGGITQSIGASVITTKKGKKITFVDTPGHAVFSEMRSRGAKIADIAILVVAADDGVKPQTKEALEYILKEDIPFIVAATKVDLPSASVNSVQSQLEKEQILFENRGGEVPLISVSGKTGKGIESLLEMTILVSELNDVSGNPDGKLEAVVIETGKDKSGPVVNIVVRSGTLKVKDEISSEVVHARIKAIFDFQGKSVKQVLPGEPAKLLGFSDLPLVGSSVWRLTDGKLAPRTQEVKIVKAKLKEGKLPVIIKAKTAGTLEAIISNLPEEVVVVNSAIGDIVESDIFLGKSTGADIFAFESKVASGVSRLAEEEGVRIEKFSVVYELFEKLEKMIEKGKVKILGEAEILKLFPFNKKKVAGCRIAGGVIAKGNELTLVRNKNELGKAQVVSLKKAKQEVDAVKQGEECGIFLMPQLEFEVGDVLLSLRK